MTSKYKLDDLTLSRWERESAITYDDISAYARYHFKDEMGNPYEMAEYQIAAAHIILLRYKDLLEKSIADKFGVERFQYNIRYDLIEKWATNGGTDDLGRGNFSPTSKDLFLIWHRQTGKTSVMRLISIYLCDVIPNFEIGVFTPSKTIGERVSYKRIRDMLGSNPRLVNSIKNPQSIGSDNYLEFLNGSRIESLSIYPFSSSTTIEGRTFHMGWVDEASFAKGRMIRGSVKPMLNMRDGLLIHTGRYPTQTSDNHVYEYIDGNSKENCSSIIIPLNKEIRQYIPPKLLQKYINSVEEAIREHRDGIMSDDDYYSHYLLRPTGMDTVIIQPHEYEELSEYKPIEHKFQFLNIEYYIKHMDEVISGGIKVPTMNELGIGGWDIFGGMDVARTQDHTALVIGGGLRLGNLIYKKFIGGYQFERATSFNDYLDRLVFILRYLIPMRGLQIDYTSEKSFTDVGLKDVRDKLKTFENTLTKEFILERYDMKVSKKHTSAVDSLQHSLRRRLWFFPDLTKEFIDSDCYRLSRIQWTHTRVEERQDGSAKVLNSVDKKKYRDDWSDALFYLNDIIDRFVGSTPMGAVGSQSDMEILPENRKLNNPSIDIGSFNENIGAIPSVFGDTFEGLEGYRKDLDRYKKWK